MLDFALVAHAATWGDWRGLTDTPRYARLAMLIAPYATRVLDVGCGTGQLRAYLPATCAYVGLDRSTLAIAEARATFPRDTFLQADVTTARVSGHFSIIVFNEVLYYLPDPVAVLRRYAAHTTVIAGSIYQQTRSRRRDRWAVRIGLRRYASNVACDQLVRAALPDWPILADEVLTLPTNPVSWHLWVQHHCTSGCG